MIETYRMLGREREADLSREGERLRRASFVRPLHRRPVAVPWARRLHTLIRTATARRETALD